MPNVIRPLLFDGSPLFLLLCVVRRVVEIDSCQPHNQSRNTVTQSATDSFEKGRVLC